METAQLKTITVHNIEIKCVKVVKYVGFLIDSELNWDKHIASIISKLRAVPLIFFRLRGILKTEILLQLYYAYVYSHISYMCIVWGRAPKSYIRPLFTLQLRIIKTMLNIDRRTHTRELISHYKLFPPQLICYLQACVYAFKCIKYNIPAVFEHSVNKVHSYNSRKPASITMKHCRMRRFGRNG